MEIGEEIKRLRLAKRMSQGALAKKLGTYQPEISRYEKGAVIPTEETLSKIWQVLKTQEGAEQMSDLFNRDFSIPVYALVDTNTKTNCLQCGGKGKLKVIIGTSKRDAMCAQCDGSGAVNGIAKGVAEMHIRKIEDVYTVEGNSRKTVFHLQNRAVRNGAIFERTNSSEGYEVFETKKQAELVLKVWKDGGGK